MVHSLEPIEVMCSTIDTQKSHPNTELGIHSPRKDLLADTIPLALLVPQTDLAHKTLLNRTNRLRLIDPLPWKHLLRLPRKRIHAIAKIDHALLKGRTCFSFGSSRSNMFQFAATAGVLSRHFIIKLKTSDGALQIRNISTGQLSVCRQGEHPVPVCCGKAVALESGDVISVGPSTALRFLVVLPGSEINVLDCYQKKTDIQKIAQAHES